MYLEVYALVIIEIFLVIFIIEEIVTNNFILNKIECKHGYWWFLKCKYCKFK